MNLQRRGFSLVLALAVMGLLVLVILSLSGLLAVESRVAAAGLAGRQARLNALVAARLAVGQLQLLAGNDQRVTARADILQPTAPGADRNSYIKLTQLSDQRRWWTGVWSTGGADSSKIRDWDPANPDSRIFAGWLISPQGDNEIHSVTLSRSLTGEQTDAFVKQVEQAPTTTRRRVTLLGGDSLPPGTTLVNGRVESDVASFPDTTGGYAWWTADEGIKARVNLVDPLAAKAGSPRKESPGANEWWKGFAGVAIGRVGVEVAGTTQGDTTDIPIRPSAFLPGFQLSMETVIQDAADNGTAWNRNPLLLATTRDTLQAWSQSRAELDEATRTKSESGVARGWHDLTTSSRGILTNALDGGLRVDLSVAFELPFATSGTTKGWSELDWFRQSPDTNPVNLAAQAAVRPNIEINPTNEPLSEEWNKAPGELPLKLGFVFEIPIPTDERRGRISETNPVVRGPTWDLLRNYYRLYKREREAVSAAIVPNSSQGSTNPAKAPYTNSFTVNPDAWLAHGMEPYTFAQGSTGQANSAPSVGGAVSQGLFGTKSNFASLQSGTSVTAPTTNYRHKTEFTLLNGYSTTSTSNVGQPWPTRARLAPHIVRAGMVHSLIYVNNALVIGLDPFVVLHNPYNVPVEFIGVGMNWALFNNTRYDIYRADRTDSPVATAKLGADGAQRTFSYRMFGTTPAGAWKVRPSGNMRMLPGEVQIITPNLAGDRWQVPRGTQNTNVAMGTFLGYDLNSNFRITAYTMPGITGVRADRGLADLGISTAATQAEFNTMIAPAEGALYTSSEPLYVQMVVDDQSQYNAFQFYLFRSNRYGSQNNPNQANDLGYRAWSGNNFNAYADTSDEHLLQQVAFRARPTNLVEPDPGNMIKSQPFNKFPQTDTVFVTGSLNKNFFAITDLRLRSSAETNGFPMPLMALNPRAAHADPRNLDNGGDTSPGWSLSIRRTSGDPSLSEFQMVPGTPVGLGRSLASWGNSFQPGSATTPVILYQIPSRPLLSLAQFVHADIGLLDTDSGYAIGNSYASPWLDSLDKVMSWPSTGGGEQERIDLSYAANFGLWDRYFFSGFNAGTAKSANGTTGQPYATITQAVDALFLGRQSNDDRSDDILANRRMTWGRFPISANGDTELKLDFVKPTRTAKQLINEGAFNVNSTSVAAWKAQLASGFQTLANGMSATPEYPFSRQHPPTGESVDVNGSGNTNRWSTYRSLSESDGTLTKLAEAIVAEVRARGPFMSLADFVNRRLTNDTNGHKGALQAAIDTVSSPAINAEANTPSLGGTASNRILKPEAISPTGQAGDIPVALGRPDMVLQSDILAALGPSLAARSDTFVIRAYGEHNGASAWCEITVQRTPEWIKPSTEEPNRAKPNYRNTAPATRGAIVDTLERNPALGLVNHRLGRRFTVVSFRWVSPPSS